MYIVVGISCLFGDYLFVESEKYPKLSYYLPFVDNWMAILSVIYNPAKFYIYSREMDNYLRLDILFIFVACPFLFLGRRTDSQRRWEVYHTIWHFLTCFIILCVLDIQRCVNG